MNTFIPTYKNLKKIFDKGLENQYYVIMETYITQFDIDCAIISTKKLDLDSLSNYFINRDFHSKNPNELWELTGPIGTDKHYIEEVWFQEEEGLLRRVYKRGGYTNGK